MKNPFNLSYAPTRSTYVGSPLKEIKTASEGLNEVWNRNRSNMDKLDMMANSVKVYEKDPTARKIKMDRINAVRNQMEEYAKNGNYEDATLAASQMARDFYGDQELQHAMESRKNIDKYNETRNKLRAQGLPVLNFDDPDNFRVKGEDGKTGVFRGSPMARPDYDSRMSKIWSEIQADASAYGLTPEMIDDIDMFYRQGKWSGISREKIMGYLKPALNRYMDTNEGRVQMRELQKLRGIKDPDKAREIIKNQMLDAGRARIYNRYDASYRKSPSFYSKGRGNPDDPDVPRKPVALTSKRLEDIHGEGILSNLGELEVDDQGLIEGMEKTPEDYTLSDKMNDWWMGDLIRGALSYTKAAQEEVASLNEKKYRSLTTSNPAYKAAEDMLISTGKLSKDSSPEERVAAVGKHARTKLNNHYRAIANTYRDLDKVENVEETYFEVEGTGDNRISYPKHTGSKVVINGKTISFNDLQDNLQSEAGFQSKNWKPQYVGTSNSLSSPVEYGAHVFQIEEPNTGNSTTIKIIPEASDISNDRAIFMHGINQASSFTEHSLGSYSREFGDRKAEFQFTPSNDVPEGSKQESYNINGREFSPDHFVKTNFSEKGKLYSNHNYVPIVNYTTESGYSVPAAVVKDPKTGKYVPKPLR